MDINMLRGGALIGGNHFMEEWCPEKSSDGWFDKRNKNLLSSKTHTSQRSPA